MPNTVGEFVCLFVCLFFVLVFCVCVNCFGGGGTVFLHSFMWVECQVSPVVTGET